MIEGSYLKYIHNSVAQPSNEVDGDPDAKETAMFLCFVQHAQYKLTGGLAFVTDYQGELYRATNRNIDTLWRKWQSFDQSPDNDKSISDCGLYKHCFAQIVSRQLEQGVENPLFGDGNLSYLFKNFPATHQCSKYCIYYCLKPLLNGEGEDITSE